MGHQPLGLRMGHPRTLRRAQAHLHHYRHLHEDTLRKGYVDYFKSKEKGKTHLYIAKVTRAEYARQTMREAKKNLFGGSLKSMLSFFVKEENLTVEEIKELLDLIALED